MQTKRSAIFLFPHQDDEVGILQKIVDEIKEGSEVFCLYFTRASNSHKNSIRNSESLNVLMSYGVKKENIIFVGQMLDIEDKKLHQHVLTTKHWLDSWFISHSYISNIYVPAWEGGHPDHDCLNAVAATFLNNSRLKGNVWQFPLYNARNCPPYLYRIQSPLTENGEITKTSIGFKNRIRFIRSCLGYPSEVSAWIGLFPFFFFNYLILGKQNLQLIKSSQFGVRPHDGRLYYEIRKFGAWEQVRVAVYSLGVIKSIH